MEYIQPFKVHYIISINIHETKRHYTKKNKDTWERKNATQPHLNVESEKKEIYKNTSPETRHYDFNLFGCFKEIFMYRNLSTPTPLDDVERW